ncbi:MAG: conjugal transfer protein TraX [Lachnospiraceae bacterium]|nr:conjugal transfer protein TraX [Lachnospiraceae bacterium]
MDNFLKTKESFPFSAAVLKWIALVTMFIDHIGASYMAYYFRLNGRTRELNFLYNVLRDIGRIAFPIFIFLLVQGVEKSKNRGKYLLRMLVFAAVSELPFDLALKQTLWDPSHQNIFFTLSIGLSICLCMKYMEEELMKLPAVSALYLPMLNAGLVVSGCLVAWLLKTDYSWMGVLAICTAYILRRNPLIATLLSCFVLMFSSKREIYAFGALIPVSLYNGKRGRQAKYFFYAFYPLHFLFLYLLTRL